MQISAGAELKAWTSDVRNATTDIVKTRDIMCCDRFLAVQLLCCAISVFMSEGKVTKLYVCVCVCVCEHDHLSEWFEAEVRLRTGFILYVQKKSSDYKELGETILVYL